MFCEKCGKQIRDDAAFCPYCGSQIVDRSQQSEDYASGEQHTALRQKTESAKSEQTGHGKNGHRLGSLFVLLAVIIAIILVFLNRNKIPFLHNNAPSESASTDRTGGKINLSKDDEALNPPYPDETPVRVTEHEFFDDREVTSSYKQDDAGNLYKHRENTNRYGIGDYTEIVNTEKEFNPDGSLVSEKNSRSERSVDKANHIVTHKYYSYDNTLNSTHVEHFKEDGKTLVLDERFRPDGTLDNKVEYVTENDYTRTSYNEDNTINYVQIFEKGEEVRRTDYMNGVINHETVYDITYRDNYLIQKEMYDIKNENQKFVKCYNYEYDFDGNLIIESETDDQRITKYCKYYDAKGNETNSYVYDKDYETQYKSIYIYDENENIIACIRVQIFSIVAFGGSDPSVSVLDVKTYTYSKSGTLIQELVFDRNSTSCTHAVIYQYDEQGRIVKKTEYDSVPEYQLTISVPDANELLAMDTSPFKTTRSDHQFDASAYENAPVNLTSKQAQELAFFAMGMDRDFLVGDNIIGNREYSSQAEIRSVFENNTEALEYFLWCVFYIGHEHGPYDWENEYTDGSIWQGGYYVNEDEARQLLGELFDMNVDFNQFPAEPNEDFGLIYRNGQLSTYVSGFGWASSCEYVGVNQDESRFEVMFDLQGLLPAGLYGNVGRIYLSLSPSRNNRGYEIAGYRFVAESVDNTQIGQLNPNNSSSQSKNLSSYVGLWYAGERAELKINEATDDSVIFDISFIRLTGADNVYATIDESGEGSFQDVSGIAGTIVLGDNKVSIFIDDVPNFYFESSLVEFIGSDRFDFSRE